MTKQEHGYGCGLYAVANVLDLKNFITDERLEKSKKGVSNGQLTYYLQEDGNDIFIDVLYCDSFENKLPQNWLDLTVTGDANYMPLLIQCCVNEKYHLLGARLYQDKKLELFDSLVNEPLICELKDVNTMYESVIAIYSFNHLEDGSYVFF